MTPIAGTQACGNEQSEAPIESLPQALPSGNAPGGCNTSTILPGCGLSGEESVSRQLAATLLDAVDSGSSSALLDVLSKIALIDVKQADLGERSADAGAEHEKLELLRALAIQMRLDLHAMLMHIYQRIEASRGYLDIARHLAGRTPGSGYDLGNALPRVGLGHPSELGGQELGANRQNGEI